MTTVILTSSWLQKKCIFSPNCSRDSDADIILLPIPLLEMRKSTLKDNSSVQVHEVVFGRKNVSQGQGSVRCAASRYKCLSNSWPRRGHTLGLRYSTPKDRALGTEVRVI